jgi:hypothetical protein
MLMLVGGEALHACDDKHAHPPEQEPVKATDIGASLVYGMNTTSGSIGINLPDASARARYIKM